MSSTHYARWAALAGLSGLLACSSNTPSTTSTPSGGSGGIPGSSGAASLAGMPGVVMGGSANQAGTGGAPSSTGGVAGAGAAGAGAGGLGGGTDAGGSAGSSGAGGADPEGWVSIFNGTDLTGWVPLIHKAAYNEDPYKTFRADSVTHVIKITYDDYPNGGSFDDRCGLLYYNKPLLNYRVRATYHFVEPQAKNPVSWGKNNSGLMIFGIDPAKVTGDPEFPPLIEIQLLGTPSTGGSTSPNICTPGTQPYVISYNKGADCGNNGSGMPAPLAATWVTVEAEVHPGGDTKVYAYPPGQPDRSKPIETVTGPKYMGMAVTNGYLSIQSESQPCEFKDIQLIELP